MKGDLLECPHFIYDRSFLDATRKYHYIISYFLTSGKENQQGSSITHSARKRKRNELKVRMGDYSSSFTVHGLNWICTSQNIAEKVFWALSMAFVFGFALFMVIGYAKRYLLYDMRTEIRYVESNFIPLPALVICLRAPLIEAMSCYRNKSFISGLQCNIRAAQSTILQYNNFTSGEIKHAKYIGNGCYSINENGSLSLAGTGSQLGLLFNSSLSVDKYLSIYTISPEDYIDRKEKVFYDDNQITLQPGEHMIDIKQTQIKRLPHPYPTKCTDQHFLQNTSIKYSRPNCFQWCIKSRWLEKCGDLPDYVQTHDIKASPPPFKDTTYANRRDCLNKVWNHLNYATCGCPPPCKETFYTTRIDTFKELDNNIWYAYISNKYSKITKIVEFPDFTIEDCLGSVGGILGLAIGASSLSVVELFVYFILYVIRKVY